MIYQRDGFFSASECDELLALATKLDEGQVETGSRVERKSRVAFLHDCRHPALVRLDAAVREVNTRFFMFEIDDREPTQLAEYDEGDEYPWHLDLGPKEAAKRKLSASVQLSASSEYAGGDLQFWGADEAISRERGALIVFPSYQLHRVTLVTRGVRYSLVSWATGARSFR